jgi:ABC-2 type transport system permease protein
VIAEAFAGERERQTLEPLLASYLTDTSILIGKIASAVSYGWGHALFMLLVGLVTVNVMDVGGGFLFYSPLILIAGISLSFLASGAAACAGVIVSLRAPTVKYAQQLLSSASMLVFVLLFIAARSAPIDWWGIPSRELVPGLILYSTLILALLDAALFLFAKSRFRREKLMLD